MFCRRGQQAHFSFASEMWQVRCRVHRGVNNWKRPVLDCQLQTARIKPLLKKPTLKTTDIQNYRPISLLSFLSKTLERAVANQLSSYLSSNNLLDPHQSSFKKAQSTKTALLAVTEALCMPEPHRSHRFSFSSTCPQHLTR